MSPGSQETCTSDEGTDSSLLAVVFDSPQALSPTTANAAAAFRVTRSSRRLQRGWRRFASQHKSTSQLAQAFAAQGVATLNKQQEEEEQEAAPEHEPEPTAGFVMIGGVGSFKTSSKHECFEDFAKKLQSPVTIKAAQVGWHGPGPHRRRLPASCFAALRRLHV